MYPGATLLHRDRIHALWEPAGLSTGMQPGGSERCRAALHGHSDLLCYGVPGEEELHSQVSEVTPSWWNSFFWGESFQSWVSHPLIHWLFWFQ